MSDPADPLAILRERVELQEQALGAAVRELGSAARRSLGPAHWIRERPLVCMTGALAVGWWLGSHRRRAGRGRR
jgi:hypothetical protein